MTREEALLKLLAVEPETKDRLIVCTGWSVEETVATLDRLLAEHRVGYGKGPYASPGRRLYFPRVQP